jgi:predicted nucleotidyltransferase
MKLQEALQVFQKGGQELVTRYPISSLSIFGSVARDDTHQDSDIDILVEFSQRIGLFQFIELKQRLEILLECPVDLATPRSLRPRIRDQVLREAIRVV